MNEKVLIVDDEQAIADLVEVCVKNHGRTIPPDKGIAVDITSENSLVQDAPSRK